MDEKVAGEYWDDWRDHFDSLESIAGMTDVNVLCVGNNRNKREKFPVEVLGYLPELRRINLRNFEIDFTNFPGVLSRSISEVCFDGCRISGDWFAHWKSVDELVYASIRGCKIEECSVGPKAEHDGSLEKLWSISVFDSVVPKEFFPYIVKNAVNLEGLGVSSTEGFSLDLLRSMPSKALIGTIILDKLSVNQDWIVELLNFSSVKHLSIEQNKDLELDDILLLAELPLLILKYLSFDYKPFGVDAVTSFLEQWREIKRVKALEADPSFPHRDRLPEGIQVTY